MKAGASNIYFVAGAHRLRKTLQQNQSLYFAVQEQRHDLPPVEAIFVDEPPASQPKQIAYSPKIVETVPQRIQICNRTAELAAPARVTILSAKSEIHHAIPRQTCPGAIFGIVLGMDEKYLHE
jgi:hypothetical protein